MCLFGARGVEENRLVFLISIFVDKNLEDYGRVGIRLPEKKIELVNNITGREGVIDTDNLDNNQLIRFLTGKLGVRDLVKKEEKKDET